jgi:hypothetical protein
MTLLVAELAGAVERTINTIVGTFCLVVTDLTAVEAFTGETSAALWLIGAVASEVTSLLAAITIVSTVVSSG